MAFLFLLFNSFGPLGLISCQRYNLLELWLQVMVLFLLIKNFIFYVFSGSGKHTIFGRVCRGMEIVKRLGSVQTDSTDRFVFLIIFLNAKDIIDHNIAASSERIVLNSTYNFFRFTQFYSKSW